jgi:quercetin dioxygenase-like cupin family protein
VQPQPQDPDPRGEIPLAASDRSRPRFLSRTELLASPFTSGRDGATFADMRVAYRGLVASKARCSLTALPVGQRIPAHSTNVEHIFVLHEGALDIVVEGERFRLHKMDELFVPVGKTFEIINVALETSTWLTVICPVDEWPERLS